MSLGLDNIFNAGVTDNTDFREATRLRGMNIGALIGISLALISIFLGRDSLAFVIHLSVLAFILALSFFFNYIHQIKLSRYFVIISLFAWLIEASMVFGDTLGLENHFYVALVCLLIFETENRSRLINAAIITIALTIVKLYQKGHPSIVQLPALSEIFYINDIFIPCIIITILCWYMLNDVEKYQNRILKNKALLKNSNELKDKMLSIIGHDMRSPINSLKAVVELLGDNQFNEDERMMVVADLQEKLTRSEAILNDLLEWSSQNYLQSSAKIPHQKKLLDVYEIAAQVMEWHKDTACRKNVTLINLIIPGTWVTADPDQLQFIFRNLLGNALKFSYSNGEGKIIASAAKEKNMITISITDNGTGISAEKLRFLFQLEKRISTEGTMNEKGTGLGLLFCKEFVENNGGTIIVQSKEGEGSTFRFTLPVA